MNRIGRFVILLGLVIGLLVVAHHPADAAFELKGQTECIAPSNPGGGWDAICRTTSAVLQKTGMLKSPMYVTNMPGGSGAVAIANVITKRKGDTNLIVAASNALTFTMSMGRTPHTYKDVIPLGQVGAELGGFFVRADSKLKNLNDLVSALKADPKSVNFAAGSAPGSLDHIKAALLAKAIGVDPTKVVYVPFQGGGEALTSLLGGHTNVAGAIINPPESAILAVGTVARKPVVINDRDEVAVRPIMTLTLSADHRVIDGVVAARFLNDLMLAIETPETLLY